jgi:hypothetical protein
MGIGKDYARKNSKFVSFDEDGVVEGIFEGMKPVIKDSFGEEKEVMRYKLDGKTFDSMAGSLAVQMDDVQIGQRIKITRSGSNPTKYQVEILQ